MQYENLMITVEGGIALLTVSREKALNALNTQTILELQKFFGEDAYDL